jgi:hypothetical protein
MPFGTQGRPATSSWADQRSRESIFRFLISGNFSHCVEHSRGNPSEHSLTLFERTGGLIKSGI